jgi:hypothetical protein
MGHRETLLMPKQQMILAARSAGLMPLGFVASIARSEIGTPSARWCAARVSLAL